MSRINDGVDPIHASLIPTSIANAAAPTDREGADIARYVAEFDAAPIAVRL
jgi:hypothetical protein